MYPRVASITQGVTTAVMEKGRGLWMRLPLLSFCQIEVCWLFFWKLLGTRLFFSRPGRSQGLLYKDLRD